MKKNMTKIIFIFLCLFTYIVSDEGECTCSLVTNNQFACTSTNSNCNCKFKYPSSCILCNIVDFDSDNYYSIEGGVCSNSCLGNKIIMPNKECTSEEIVDDFYQLGDIFYIDDPSNGNTDTEIECESSTKICRCKNYYYIEDLNNKKIFKCINTVPTGYLYLNSKTREFLKYGCPEGLKVTKSISIGETGITRCSDSCSSDEFYSSVINPSTHISTESCSDDCNKKTYIQNGVKKCVDCADINLYEKGDFCVELDKCKFYSENKCYTSCSEIGTKDYHNYGNKECISNCEGDYLYKDETNKICYKRDQCNFIDVENSLCYTACPTGSGAKSYHNYDSNICILDCTSTNTDKLYHNANDKICYPSCLVIPGGDYIYELDNYLCKKESELSDGECNYYYIKNDGVKRCFSQEECKNNGYAYFVDEECRENCDGYYKMSDDSGYIKCYENLQKVKSDGDIKYYNIKSKLAWKEFPTESTYYIIKADSGPEEIVEECESYYYKNEGTGLDNLNYCIDKCSSVELIEGGYFFISGNKKCESDCANFNMNKHYYDPENNECLDSCKGTNKAFQNPISSTTQKCLGSCDEDDNSNTFHNFDSNICILNCGADSSNKLYHKEDEKICYPSCLSIPNGDYIYEFDGNICKNSNTDCDYYYFKNDGVIKCISAEKCKNDNNIYLIGKQCSRGCDDYYKYEDIISGKTFFRCFLNPNECLSYFNEPLDSTTKVYYSKKLKKCWDTYPEGYYINSDESASNEIEVVEECQNFYYKVSATSESDIDKYYCVAQCKDQGKYFINTKKKCEETCSPFHMKYFNPANNECLENCKGLEGFEFANKIASGVTQENCRNKCDESDNTNNQYYDSGTNICIGGCDTNSAKKFHANDGKVCYSSCAEIPGGEYIYEQNYICYKSVSEIPSHSSSCQYYYIKANKDKQCISDNDCISKNLNYFIYEQNSNEIECRENCDGYFKLESSKTIGEETLKFTKCYSSISKALEDPDVKFYNIPS